MPVCGWYAYLKEIMYMKNELIFKNFENEVTQFPPPRSRHGASVVGDKLVIIAGHKRVASEFIRCNDIWTFDLVNGTFSEVEVTGESVPVMSRIWTGAVGNTVYTFGGIKHNGKKLNKIYSFNTETLEWKKEPYTGMPPSKRCDPLGVAYKNKIIIVGGSDKDLNFPIDVYEYDTDTHVWTNIPLMGNYPSSRIACCCSRIDNMMYIYGGGVWDKEAREYVEQYTDTWALNLDTYNWINLNTHITTTPNVVNIFPVMFPIGNHLILDGGRYNKESVETFIFDTIQCKWTPANLAQVDVLSNNCATANFHNGTAYLFGGNRGRASQSMIKINFAHVPFQMEYY
jgi:hypothetical protein